MSASQPLDRGKPESVPVPALDLLVWHWGRVGAGAKFTHEMLKGLRKVPGVSASLCAVRGSDLDADTAGEPGLGVTLVRTFSGDKAKVSGRIAAAFGLLSLPWLSRDFRRAVDRSPDTVALCTFQSIWDVAVLRFLARRKGRFVLVLHDALFHPGDGYPFRTSVMAAQIRAADGLVVLSDHVGRMAHEVHGFPKDRIWTVPHGAFAFGDGKPVARPFPACRPFRLLFLGRIVAYKGLGVLIEAHRLMLGRGLSVELDIVGQGDMSRHAEALAWLPGVRGANGGASDAEIEGALARADLVVLPYVEASQSGVAAAAMTAGLPIVATPVGGLVEQVFHGRTGIVADGVRPEDVADAVATLIANPALYERCSAGALRKATDELGWDRIAGVVAGILRDVAARPRRRDEA